jgi:hypothetical protein
MLSVADEWILVPRYGAPPFREFHGSEAADLVRALVDALPMSGGVSDDLYALASDGSALVTFDHHLDEGLFIDLSDVRKTSVLLAGLNELGVEFQMIPRRRQ